MFVSCVFSIQQVTKLFKITVSFGSVNSLISMPAAMSHASIPAEVKKSGETFGAIKREVSVTCVSMRNVLPRS